MQASNEIEICGYGCNGCNRNDLVCPTSALAKHEMGHE